MVLISFIGICFPAKPKKENEDLGIQFENSESERPNTNAGNNTGRKSLVDPTHIARVARRANRDGKKNPYFVESCHTLRVRHGEC